MADYFLGLLHVCELFTKLVSGSAKSIVDLRMFAIASNLFGSLFNGLTGAWPQFLQTILETPIHIWRLRKTRRAMHEVERAENPAYAVEIIKKLASRRKFLKDQTIFAKGDIAHAAYVIDSGSIKVVGPNAILSSGDLFGEMGLFTGDKLRTATTVAMQDVELHEIPYDTFETVYARNPEIGFAVMRLMNKRFAKASHAFQNGKPS